MQAERLRQMQAERPTLNAERKMQSECATPMANALYLAIRLLTEACS